MYKIDRTLCEEWMYRWLGNVTHSNRPQPWCIRHLLHSETLLAPSMHQASTAKQTPACTLDTSAIYYIVNPCLHPWYIGHLLHSEFLLAPRCIGHLPHTQFLLVSWMHQAPTPQQIAACTPMFGHLLHSEILLPAWCIGHLLHSKSLLAPSMHLVSTACWISSCTLDAVGIYCRVNPSLYPWCIGHLLHSKSLLTPLMHSASTAHWIFACTLDASITKCIALLNE